MDGRLTASLVLKRGAAARVGLERAALLEAIADTGSLAAAARQLGLSYKGAWDAVQVLNNLFDAPLVEAAPGGRSGGAAALTPRGRAVIAGFRRVEAEIAAALARLETGLAGAPDDDLGAFWSLGLKTSARNALRGTVTAVRADAVSGEVDLALGQGAAITAILTRRSIDDLALTPGRAAIALIKSGFVILGAFRTGPSGSNRIAGIVASRDDGSEASEIALDIGGGKTLIAALPRNLARQAPQTIAVGDRVTAWIDPAHVILAVE
ncbi:molybdate transport system regulatory protein [Caulobacter ginsengisoli]|uniref:Molybdate transport system regulatory protein n=1 Tax=Caulobacter ginsengisoli TaxID=400775 RepID=A0ABU0ITL0_9CAUL|nr:TOBE domain-containing protein [Caulobacter ginsengisoli]MDQ0465339.1 molybdate transport system regulatory protein [Caulobacter ginsengisoli]